MNRNVLVLRALGLGDLLTGVPALRALRRAFPAHRITLAAPAQLSPLALLTGAVDHVLPTSGLTPVGWRGSLDVAVNLHGRGPQSHRLLRALHPARLMAFAHPALPEVEGPEWRADEHEVERWCRLVTSYGFRADPRDLDMARPHVPNPARGCVLVHPGAASAARRWPPERFAAVIRALRRNGSRVVVTGNAEEVPLARQVAELGGVPADDVLAGRTTLLELAALVAGAGLVICGDTGTGHLATAYRTPSVLLFGPVPPALWGPPPGRTEHTVLWSGERGDPHGGTPDRGLLAIGVEEVVSAALTRLEARVPA